MIDKKAFFFPYADILVSQKESLQQTSFYVSLIRTESYGHIQLSGNLGNTVVLVEYILIPSKFGSGAKGKMNTGNLQPLPYSGCLKY